MTTVPEKWHPITGKLGYPFALLRSIIRNRFFRRPVSPAWRERLAAAEAKLDAALAEYDALVESKGLPDSPLDHGIRPLLIRLWALGFKTGLSCGGHWDEENQKMPPAFVAVGVDDAASPAWERFSRWFLDEMPIREGVFAGIERIPGTRPRRYQIGFRVFQLGEEIDDDAETALRKVWVRRCFALLSTWRGLDEAAHKWLPL